VRTTTASVLLAALLAGASPARAIIEGEGPVIPGVSTWVAGRDLHVDTRLAPALPEDVLQRLASGLPTTVTWQLRLFSFRNLWFDGLKDERRYAVTATYRPVTSDYAVERRIDARLLDTKVVPTRGEAAAALAKVPGLPFFTMGDHLLGQKLLVRVRCLYGSGVALGVVPTSAETAWVRSGIFEWTASDAR
jgi:Domain of unknown function (DUF4390)